MDSKIKKCCPNCSQLFYIKTLSPTPKGNIPLFLTCGHSMCENCISNILKFLEPIECKVCHQDMEINASDIASLSQGKIKLYDMFPVNLYMLGELAFQTMKELDSKQIKTTEEPFLDLHALLKSVDDTQGKCLECHHPTSKMCQQCGIILCDSCFNKSHKNFVIFKNHMHQEIETLSDINTCKLHQEKSLEYYCKDCKKSICMDCLMVGGEKSCKNHNVVSMQEVNQDFLEELCDVSPKVDETFRRLTKTAVDIGHLLHNMDNETGSASEFNQIMATVEQHFSRLHSLLQEHKTSIIGDINKLKYAERDSLIKAKKEVAEAIKSARRVMKTINVTSDKQKLKKINLSLLLENAKKIAETPWLLSHDGTNANPLEVAVNEELCTKISEYVRLETKPTGLYKLRSTAELGEDATLSPPPPAPVYPPELPKDVRMTNISKPREREETNWAKTPAFFKSAPKYHSKNASHTSLNSIGSESSAKSYGTQGDTYQKLNVQPVSPFTESQHPKQLHEGCQELIYVSHIVDPHNFYVQRACHQGLVKEMLREFRNAISLPKPSANHVTEGKVYLALNKADNIWQRCRIVSIDRKDVNNPLYHVFCVDFGSTETVTIDKLRLLSPARLQSPYPLAINCCLANCDPLTGSWTSDDSILMQNIIDNKQAVIHVRKIRSTNNFSVTLDCDVTTYEDGISIAHALVFHERAKMTNPKLQYPLTSGVTQKPKLFSSKNDFKPKSVEEVYISHVISPDKFFVRKRHLQSVYEKLTEDMEQEYSLSVHTGSVYLPEKGMVYAVNIEKCSLGAACGAWARGVVEDRPGRGRGRLLLPDVGASVLVHWSALRHLHARFTTRSALATECHLAGVTPLQKKWSPGSVALLQQYCGILLQLHVEDSSCGVTLYHHEDEEPICINNLMIKHKFGVCFGVFKFNKNDDAQDQVITNKSPLDKPKPKVKKQKTTILQRNAPIIKEKDLEAKDKGPLRLEAKILHYQSPSLIYVALVHQQKTFNVLYETMQKHYTKNKGIGKAEWKVGDRCCAVCGQSKTWRRAVILELEGTDAKIFYSDFACIESLPIEKLKELTPDFESVGHAAIKCHLSGVRPAVGEEWPSLTKEYLSELLEAYKRVFITKSGNFKNQSMPIEIWVYHTVQGGALEPNKSEWRCLNKKIIEQGLGIPDNQEIPESTPNTEGDEEMLSFLNITGSVHDWLQLEPTPTKPVVLSHSDSNRSTPRECEEVEDDLSANTPDTIFISDWLPAEPLPSKEFTAMPTYIDNDGVIYLHDAAQQDTLDLIRKALDVKFKNPDPKAKYSKWTVGEPCIALFFLDNRFYRGRVLEVNKEASTCLIHYIDYGNEELCSFTNLRKSVALYQIPIQAHRCFLDRIRPVGGKWDRQSLDYIHKSIVEKQCYVKVSGETVNGLKPIELKYNKLWINDHLVEFEMAVYTDGSKATVRKFAVSKANKKHKEAVIIESDSGPDYIVDDDRSGILSESQDSIDINSFVGKDWNKLMEDEELTGQFITFPKNHLPEEFKCSINIINDLNILELTQIHDEETNRLYQKMFEQLQVQGEDSNPLNGIYENKACIALFQEDNQWYRATVVQYSEAKHQIKVRYVDYGNVEIVSLADVREIKEEWTKLPPATIAAKLYGVQLNKHLGMQVIAQEFSETFLNKEPFNANIITYEDSIPNVVLRNEIGELVYDNLIEKVIFIKTD